MRQSPWRKETEIYNCDTLCCCSILRFRQRRYLHESTLTSFFVLLFGPGSNADRERYRRSVQVSDVQPAAELSALPSRGSMTSFRSSVKSGYRNVSPLFNGLETAGNFINGGLLRPVYHDSPIVLPDGVNLNTNMFTTPVMTEIRQLQAGFCFTCHAANVEQARRLYAAVSRGPAAFRFWRAVFAPICSARCAITIWWIRTAIRFCPPPSEGNLPPRRAAFARGRRHHLRFLS